jgi:ABC-type molybdate transport system permease subunit
MPHWDTEVRGPGTPGQARIRPVVVATLLAALPGLPLAALAAWFTVPDAGALRILAIALATLPLLALTAVWAVGRVPAAAPRIAASCGAAPPAVLGRVWLPLIWPGTLAGVMCAVGGAVVGAAAMARLFPAG